MEKVEKWGVFEASIQGSAQGNPFLEQKVTGKFVGDHEEKEVPGFYDGNGIYRVRFMPSFEGIYHYEIRCTASDETVEGSFEAVAPAANNHGPVRVANKYGFAYEDGNVYQPIGTTCYAWACQSMELQEQTLETLRGSSFNKIRFCFFPKFYQYNEHEPITYPYERGEICGQDPERAKRLDQQVWFVPTQEIKEVRDFDFTRFDVEHFRRFDLRIAQLMEMGIEADMILFHPYDKWGFSAMTREANEEYLSYVAARYSAYRNVWWSMANEYDILGWPLEEWKAYGEQITGEDPYHHLCSVHNCMKFYDYTEDWITHCSCQRIDLYKHVELTNEMIDQYQKPVVWDEICYEGNIDNGWGNITGEELVRRFYESVLRGGCAGHGETFMHPQNILWWSHGGTLHGESEPRFAFLKKIWEDVPGGYLKWAPGIFDETVGIPADQERIFDPAGQKMEMADYELHYYGFGRPGFKMLAFPPGKKYHVDLIDTWNMTITDCGVREGVSRVEMPGRQWMMLRFRAVK